MVSVAEQFEMNWWFENDYGIDIGMVKTEIRKVWKWLEVVVIESDWNCGNWNCDYYICKDINIEKNYQIKWLNSLKSNNQIIYLTIEKTIN